MCGENKTAKIAVGKIVGSPPRVRGKPIVSSCENFELRITPACAGKTFDEETGREEG